MIRNLLNRLKDKYLDILYVKIITGNRTLYFSVQRTGNLGHYYHFILDFVIPFEKFIKENKLLVDNLHSITFSDKSILFFHSFIYDLYKCRINSDMLLNLIGRKGKFNQSFNLNVYDVHQNSTKNILGEIRSNIKQRLIESSTKEIKNKVILIEREFNRESSGGYRRYIENHSDLCAKLERHVKKSNLELINVVLSGMSFKEQVKLFSSARVIVGQHGAGLVNMLWASDELLSIIELDDRDNRKHFELLSKYLDYNYVRVLARSRKGSGIDIDPQQVTTKIAIEI